MKKVICLLMTIALLFTSAETAFAKKHNDNNDKKHEQRDDTKDNKQEFKIDDSPVIKYDRFIIPLAPITKGMGATVTFDKNTAILTVTKGSIKIVINFKDKTVYVNGNQDTKSGIFTAKNSKKATVLIKYIAKILGYGCEVDDDEIIIEVPDLNLPSNITLTPVGATFVANTLNNTTLYLIASATITAGQATGGRAELYVGSTKVATDTLITATDNTVTFTTSDNTSTTAEMQAAIPKGGEVKVKLYNSNNKSVTSAAGNPTLKVDYSAPTITGISSASYTASSNQIKLYVTGASAVGDNVDVTKISISDVLGRTYQLTNSSNGVVSSSGLIEINLGATDKVGLSGFGSSATYLTVATGSLIKDAAGNVSPGFVTTVTVPISVANVNDLPSYVTVTPIGSTVLDNTLNNTTLYITATAYIPAGQATGGRAELYVGNRLVASDFYIASNDTTVTFTTSDGTPTNAELQSIIPTGGLVTVKLYNINNSSVTSAIGNPTLTVDYIAPTITGITSANYTAGGNQIKLNVTGVSAVGDKVDVTKISITDTAIGKTYQLTNNSNGVISNSNFIEINLGSSDKAGLAGFGSITTYLTIATGSLLKDAAGNVSPSFTTAISIPLTFANVLDLPNNVTVTPVGTTVVANTLNSTTQYLTATARITAGQATGGRAELYVGNKLVATDPYIASTDTTVTFTTSDGSPINTELQSLVPAGGVVTVKLYNINNSVVTSTVGNPTLVVDYVAPTITSINSAIYNVASNQLFLNVSGASAVGDKVDVTKITLHDSYLNGNYQLTNSTTGSNGSVISSDSILVNIGPTDKAYLYGFGTTTVYLTISNGVFLTDAAGNVASVYTASQSIPVTVLK